MKNFLSIYFSLISISLYPLYSENQEAYIQMSSSVTQTPNLITGTFILSDKGSAIPINNFDVSPNYDFVICKIPGMYLICTGLEIAVLSKGVSGYVDSWFELNGSPVPASNSRQFVNQDSPIAPVTNIFLMELKAGDTFGTKFIASGPNIGLICIKNLTDKQPDILSFGITLVKIY